MFYFLFLLFLLLHFKFITVITLTIITVSVIVYITHEPALAVNVYTADIHDTNSQRHMYKFSGWTSKYNYSSLKEN